ncbi:MAG: cell division protein FtsL, partial [Pseudomonadota bacterium]
ALEEEQRRLRLQLSLLRTPQSIERIARERLGMARPDQTAIRVLRPVEILASAETRSLGAPGLP